LNKVQKEKSLDVFLKVEQLNEKYFKKCQEAKRLRSKLKTGNLEAGG
jgi:hypothetical protein